MAAILSRRQCVNSFWYKDDIWCHRCWSWLVHIMVCRRVRNKQLTKRIMTYWQSIGPPGTKFSKFWVKILNFFLLKNASGSIVCKMTAISFFAQYVIWIIGPLTNTHTHIYIYIYMYMQVDGWRFQIARICLWFISLMHRGSLTQIPQTSTGNCLYKYR